MDMAPLRKQVEEACRHLLSEQNRDPYALAYGCFDRRYWGWKLVDYPEATYQRNVHPLAWLLRSTVEEQSEIAGILRKAIKAGLEYSTKVQRSDGSFDQAFPYEHSFGATAFLLHPLLSAYKLIKNTCSASCALAVESSLHRAAEFLCSRDETHGHITNHLAGAVLSLLVSADYFQEPRFDQRATELLASILARQSPEGWFLEYEGADPGYQTLSLYYLAQVYYLRPDGALGAALEKAIRFLSWFVHPDGSFGGEYGSRRTAVYYPGGLALLSQEFPLALSMTRFMLNSVSEGRTVTLGDVDMGNLAPLLSNCVMVLDVDLPPDSQPAPPLPFEVNGACQDFPAAGLYARGSKRYYSIVGASNGGVLKVFDRERRAVVYNDSGYAGQTDRGCLITTQITNTKRAYQATRDEVKIEAPFYRMLRSVPSPFQFLVLRSLNLTIMRSVRLGNLIKGLLVRLLISGKRVVPLHLTRTVKFETDCVIVTDELQLRGRLALRWLEYGRPFVAIHMASARYFEGWPPSSGIEPPQVDVTKLNSQGKCQLRMVI